jgi:sugar phosphate isomerase/epimerase
MKKGHQTGDHSGGAPAEADVAVGTGQIDYPGVLRAAKEIGVKRYYIEDESTDPLGNIPQSVAFLEKVQF